MGAAKGLASADSYDADMVVAKKAGIDAFALNIGTDGWAQTQLVYAYASAAKNGMSVFISFDFNRFDPSQALDMANVLGTFITLPAQLKVDGKPFVSTFSGDGLDLQAVRNFVKENKGLDLFIVPNFKADNPGGADGLFNWMAWPSNGDNKAPNATVQVPVKAGDDAYQKALGTNPYMARKSLQHHLAQLRSHSFQPFHPGSPHITVLRSLIVKTGFSRLIYFGLAAGMKSSPSTLDILRCKPSMTMEVSESIFGKPNQRANYQQWW